MELVAAIEIVGSHNSGRNTLEPNTACRFQGIQKIFTSLLTFAKKELRTRLLKVERRKDILQTSCLLKVLTSYDNIPQNLMSKRLDVFQAMQRTSQATNILLIQGQGKSKKPSNRLEENPEKKHFPHHPPTPSEK